MKSKTLAAATPIPWNLALMILIPTLLSFQVIGQDTSQPSQTRFGSTIEPAVLSQLQRSGSARVIILLRENSSLTDIKEIQDYTSSIQNQLLARISVIEPNSSVWDRLADWWQPRDFLLSRRYQSTQAIAGELRLQSAQRISEHAAVEAIIADGTVRALRYSAMNQTSILPAQSLSFNGRFLTGSGQGVCIIDTGIDYHHPELAPVYAGGKDFTNNDNDPLDDHGHGTHVAGIVHASAPNATIISIKALNSQGAGTFSDVLAGIDWCTSNNQLHNISVITMSIGDQGAYSATTCPSTFDSAVASATTARIVVVGASGNDGSTTGISMPACTSHVIAVGSVNQADAISSFTNRGSRLDLLAPGQAINSTHLGGGYTTLSGTSMAAPFAAGTAALLLQYSRSQGFTISPSSVKEVLTTLGTNTTGWPRLNALASALSYSPAAGANLSGSNQSIATSIRVQDQTGANLSAPLTIQRPHGLELRTTTNTLFSVSAGAADLNLGLNRSTLNNLRIEGVTLSSNTANITNIIINQLSASSIPYPSTGGFALDLFLAPSSNQTISFNGAGDRAYLCMEWNTTRLSCEHEAWTLVKEGTIVGNTYNVTTHTSRTALFQQKNPQENQAIELDAFISESSPLFNYGKTTILSIGNQTSRYRSLLYYNTTAIPRNASILAAELTLFLFGGSNGSMPSLNAYRATMPWTEGRADGNENGNAYENANGNSISDTDGSANRIANADTDGYWNFGGATWQRMNRTTSWNSPGGDIDPAIASSAVIPHNPFGIVIIDARAFVAGWVNGTWDNTGILLASSNESSGSTMVSFASREHPNISLRPSWNITWIEQERNPPRITDVKVSSKDLLLGDSLCILSNATDENNVSDVYATIGLPNSTLTATLTSITLLDDDNSCNSAAHDGVFSGLFSAVQEGNYSVVHITSSDGLGNTNSTIIQFNFSVRTGLPPAPASSATKKLGPSSIQRNGKIINPSFINTSNRVTSTDLLLPGDNTISLQWPALFSTETLNFANITIEQGFDFPISPSTLSGALDYFNGLSWNTLCLLSITKSLTNQTCILSGFNPQAFIFNNITLRMTVKNSGNFIVAHSIDLIALTYQAFNDATAPIVLNPRILNPPYTHHSTLQIEANATDETRLDTVTTLIKLPNNTIVSLSMNLLGNTTYGTVFNQTALLGSYTATVLANDSHGNINNASSINFSIADVIAPQLFGLTANPAQAEPNSTITITANATDDYLLDTVLFEITYPTKISINITSSGTNFQSDTTTYTTPSTTDDTTNYKTTFTTAYTRIYTTTFVASPSDPLGTYSIRAMANDTSGNFNISSPRTFSITDTGAPIIINPLPNGSRYNDSSILNLSATITSLLLLDNVIATTTMPNGSTVKITMTKTLTGKTTQANATYSETLQLGNYTWQIRANDTGGKITISSPLLFTIQSAKAPIQTIDNPDTTNPSLFELDAQPRIGEQGSTISIRATAKDDTNISSVIATITLPNLLIRKNVLSTSGNSVYTGAFNETNLTGTYSYIIMSNDTSGNTNSSSLSTFSIMDITNPTLTDAKADTPTIIIGSPITFDATIADNVGPSAAILSIQQSNGSVIDIIMTRIGMDHYTASYTPHEQDPQGPYHATIIANDTSGNQNRSTTILFYVNGSTPLSTQNASLQTNDTPTNSTVPPVEIQPEEIQASPPSPSPATPTCDPSLASCTSNTPHSTVIQRQDSTLVESGRAISSLRQEPGLSATKTSSISEKHSSSKIQSINGIETLQSNDTGIMGWVIAILTILGIAGAGYFLIFPNKTQPGFTSKTQPWSTSKSYPNITHASTIKTWGTRSSEQGINPLKRIPLPHAHHISRILYESIQGITLISSRILNKLKRNK